MSAAGPYTSIVAAGRAALLEASRRAAVAKRKGRS